MRGVRRSIRDAISDQSQVLWAELQDAGLPSAAPRLRFQVLQAEDPQETVADVYCLAVPAGWFILENGLVVKNCDALRYMIAGVDGETIIDGL